MAGQENRQHVLGHMLLWNLKEPVMPWCSDGPDEAELGGALDATLSDWADRTHAQGGTVVAAHFPNPNGEPAVLVATGRADAVEMLVESGDAMLEYYRYLNSGYRLPLVGGTDKMSSAVPVGLYRTYARLDEEFSYEAWCRAVRSGRTFLSGGPLVTLSVDGHEPGGTVGLSGPGTVSVRAAVRSIFPLRSLEIVRNGEVVARAEANGGRQAEISEELRIDGNAWIACRAFGVDYHLDEWGPPGLRPHLAGLRRLRRRVDDGRPRGTALYPHPGRGRPRIRTAHRGPQARPAHDAPSRRGRPPRLAGAAVRRGAARAGRSRPRVNVIVVREGQPWPTNGGSRMPRACARCSVRSSARAGPCSG
jgi:hypothetical protein